MKTTETTGASQVIVCTRLRCAVCGIGSFSEGSVTFRPAGLAPHRPPGALCEICVDAYRRMPKMRQGARLAVLAGVSLIDIMPKPAPGVH
jgi:hypothetical protein